MSKPESRYIPADQLCPHCAGHGYYDYFAETPETSMECPYCGGTGWAWRENQKEMSNPSKRTSPTQPNPQEKK